MSAETGTFAGYHLVGALGGGGTSLVYRARPQGGGPDVALKILRPQFAADPALRRRFLREAELAYGLEHPHIVRVVDAGTERGTPFLALELVEAPTLRELLDGGPFPPETARAVFVALARALDHAHARGIIHRDVKPQNVFVNERLVKLGDFGNARVVSLASVTGASLTWGTPEYVAPELFGRGRADPRSDLYALGVLFYEMLTGRLPWSRSETLVRVAAPGASRPRLPATGAGDDVDDLIADLLAPSVGDRPATSEEILARISGPTALAPRATAPCAACGAARPDDVPRCLACGQEILRLEHSDNGPWRVLLNKLDDDAAATERLLRTLGPVVKPLGRPLLFLTGARAMYSDAEKVAGIELPAVLFSRLEEPQARVLESLCQQAGLDVKAVKGTTDQLIPSPTKPWTDFVVAGGGIGVLSFTLAHSVGIGLAATVGAGALILGWSLLKPNPRLSQRGEFQLRDEIAQVPVADELLAHTAAAAVRIRAPEVRELLQDVSVEIYRLTRRAAQLGAESAVASSEAELLRRMIAAAPALTARVHQLAARIDALDAVLEGTTEGEIGQRLARLERAAAAPGADRAELAATRGDLEATLERRSAAEHERARLATALCRMLGHMRAVYRRASALGLDGDSRAQAEESRALAAASAELHAFLSGIADAPDASGNSVQGLP